jgi:hypothetical protein
MTEIQPRKRGGLLGRFLDRFTHRRQWATEPVTTGDSSRPLAIASEVRASAHLDGLVLLHIPSGRVFLCNRTGARIWKGLSNGLNSDAIAEQISRDYGVPRYLVEQHTASFLTDLEQHGFVTRLAEC